MKNIDPKQEALSQGDPTPSANSLPEGRKRAKAPWLFALLGLLIGLAIPSGRFLKWQGNSAPAAVVHQGQIIASYRNDFQAEKPKPGWHYYWNQRSPVGDTNGYAELFWNETLYVADSSGALPGPAPARFLRLSPSGGHPGQGFAQTQGLGDAEFAAIMAFTVPESGEYCITNSFIVRKAGEKSGQVDVRVFVNDHEVGETLYARARQGVSFDRELGRLSAGDTVYVAVGPDEVDLNDSFDLDFSIAR
jgi:hypothetical protein